MGSALSEMTTMEAKTLALSLLVPAWEIGCGASERRQSLLVIDVVLADLHPTNEGPRATGYYFLLISDSRAYRLKMSIPMGW